MMYTWSPTPDPYPGNFAYQHPEDPYYYQGDSTTPDMDSPSQLRVAIVGGGLIAVALFRGLLRYPHINVELFESRPLDLDCDSLKFSLQVNETLKALDPDLEHCLERAGATLAADEIYIGSGAHAGRCVMHPNDLTQMPRYLVDRKELLKQLLAGTPPQAIHRNSRIKSMQGMMPPGSAGVTLTLSDGSRRDFDVVLGADGIDGFVRQYVLQPDDPSMVAMPTSYWGSHTTIPMARAREELGTEWLDPNKPPHRVAWLGDGSFMSYSVLSSGREVQLTVGSQLDQRWPESGGYSPWARVFTPEEFEQSFAEYKDKACQSIIRIIKSIYTIQITGILQRQYYPARTYVAPSACLVGETARGTQGCQAVGVNIALEEALLLSRLLGRSPPTAHGVAAALGAFDTVWRPHSERAAEAAYSIALAITGRYPGIGLDADRLREFHESDPERYAPQFDIGALVQMGLAVMDQLLWGGGGIGQGGVGMIPS